MNRGGTFRSHLNDWNSLAPDLPGHREVGRGVIVEILLGGFRILVLLITMPEGSM